MKAQSRVLKANELQRGMVVLPFWGTSFNVPSDTLNWGPTLHRDWWQHIVTGVGADEVTFSRPYAYAHEHFDTRGCLVGCEVYSIPKSSCQLYLVLNNGWSMPI
jgi:hypothetical protein